MTAGVVSPAMSVCADGRFISDVTEGPPHTLLVSEGLWWGCLLGAVWVVALCLDFAGRGRRLSVDGVFLGITDPQRQVSRCRAATVASGTRSRPTKLPSPIVPSSPIRVGAPSRCQRRASVLFVTGGLQGPSHSVCTCVDLSFVSTCGRHLCR